MCRQAPPACDGVRNPNMRERPTSPHLSVYRMFRYTLFTSFFNRMTGVALSVGLIVLVYWLMAVAGGTRSYQRAYDVLSSGILKLVYAGLIVAFSYHLVAGIRHLVWDTGRGMERAQSKRSAGIVIGVSIVLMLVLGYWLFIAGGRAP
jgi:succinate dehydrogenase / fumarate reductase cytochrome b subunit